MWFTVRMTNMLRPFLAKGHDKTGSLNILICHYIQRNNYHMMECTHFYTRPHICPCYMRKYDDSAFVLIIHSATENVCE